MKKCLFICLFVLAGIPRVSATTLVQVYPPSWLQFVAGRNAIFNVMYGIPLEENRRPVFNLPIEARHTVAEFHRFFNTALMTIGGVSLFFQNDSLASINLSAGLYFGYGYDRSRQLLPIRLGIALYPLYEFPLAVSGGTPLFPWKMALDYSVEVLQLGNFSVNIYSRLIAAIITEAGISTNFLFLPDLGLTVGWLFRPRGWQER